MSNQPNFTSQYHLNRIKDMANRTIQALDEQRTVEDVQPHVNDGLCTEAEAWRIVAGLQLIKPREA